MQRWTLAQAKGAALGFAAALALTVSAFADRAAAEVSPSDAKIVDGLMATPLTATPGDPVKGKDWFVGRKLGNCLACHVNTELKAEPFHGEVGPEMDGVADRYTAEELRAIIVNSKEVFGDQTIMPAFYRTNPGARVADAFKDKTILSAQQVEDVIAYLLTLKE